MKGQWLGNYSGTSNGVVHIDVDEVSDGFEGYAIIDFHSPDKPTLVARFRTHSKSKKISFDCRVQAMANGQPVHPDAIKQHLPDYQYPSVIAVVADWNEDELSLDWATDIQTEGSAKLPRSRAGEPSELIPVKMEWEKFKSHVSKLGYREYVFRGQEKDWRLRTGFHREGRANLERFLSNDVQTLHRHLSARTKHFFNLTVPDENGAFLNLIQHHGYPTPILDWTYSPFVASYFAFSNVKQDRSRNKDNDDCVRIFIINRPECLQILPPIKILSNVGPHFSLMEFSSVENERMIPQQGVSSVSTVDDIEKYLADAKNAQGNSILSCIDIPASYRNDAMRDLSMMGITAGSLFPGLDGACKELRERFFILEDA